MTSMGINWVQNGRTLRSTSMPLYNSKISGKVTPLLLQALILKTGVLSALAVNAADEEIL